MPSKIRRLCKTDSLCWRVWHNMCLFHPQLTLIVQVWMSHGEAGAHWWLPPSTRAASCSLTTTRTDCYIFLIALSSLLWPVVPGPAWGFLSELLPLGTLASVFVLSSLKHTIHLSDGTVKTEQLNHCTEDAHSVSYTD